MIDLTGVGGAAGFAGAGGVAGFVETAGAGGLTGVAAGGFAPGDGLAAGVDLGRGSIRGIPISLERRDYGGSVRVKQSRAEGSITYCQISNSESGIASRMATPRGHAGHRLSFKEHCLRCADRQFPTRLSASRPAVMHIRDGFLTAEVCLGTGVLAIGALGWSVRQLRDSLADRTVPLTGMTASLIFAGQMVNFALPPLTVSGHLLGGVLAAALLGPWAGCVAISLVLMIQLALFYDGGWTVLGANIVNMGLIGTWGGYAIYAALRSLLGTGRSGTLIAAFVASWLSVLAAATVFCLEFWLSHRGQGYDFSQVFGWMVFLHCLIGIGEGLITSMVLGFVMVQRPDLLQSTAGTPTALSGVGRFTFAGIVAALGVAAFLAPFASEHADGLEAAAERTGFLDLGRVTRVLFLDDYAIPGLSDWPLTSTAAAGIMGTLVVLGATWGLGMLLKKFRSARRSG